MSSFVRFSTIFSDRYRAYSILTERNFCNRYKNPPIHIFGTNGHRISYVSSAAMSRATKHTEKSTNTFNNSWTIRRTLRAFPFQQVRIEIVSKTGLHSRSRMPSAMLEKDQGNQSLWQRRNYGRDQYSEENARYSWWTECCEQVWRSSPAISRSTPSANFVHEIDGDDSMSSLLQYLRITVHAATMWTYVLSDMSAIHVRNALWPDVERKSISHRLSGRKMRCSVFDSRH